MNQIFRHRAPRTLAWAVAAVIALAIPAAAAADNGNAPVTLSFFSGGNGAHADWLATADPPPRDGHNQAIRIANRGYIIVHGEIVVAAGSVDELKGNDIVKRLYLGGAA